MTRKCEITGTTVLTGNNVSHSNRKSKRRYLPNLHKVTLDSEVVGKVRMKITANALRSIDINGGLDNFLLTQPNSALSQKAYRIKKKIKESLKEIKENIL